MRRVLVTGCHGFVGQALVEAGRSLSGVEVTGVARDAWDQSTLAGVDAVIHAGRHPLLGTPGWRVGDDVEPELARACAQAGVRMVSLSSRTAESAASLYGQQKRQLEQALRGVDGLGLTVLRAGNLFGHEVGRRTFMGTMQTRLIERSEILFDMSPFTRRDFLPVDAAARIIIDLALDPPKPGQPYPLGSGVGLQAGKLALALIEGYGRGRLVWDGAPLRDGFTQDTAWLRERGVELPDEAEILGQAKALGRRLRSLRER